MTNEGAVMRMVCLSMVVLSSGCYGSDTPMPGGPMTPVTPMDAGPDVTVPTSPDAMPDALVDAMPDAAPPADIRDVDILLVLDNSESMVEEQAALAGHLTHLIQVLATGALDPHGPDFPPVRSIHFGVISTHMGTGGYPVSSCAGDRYFGDDAILNSAGRGEGCQAMYPTPLQMRTFGDLSPEAFAEDMRCIANLGAEGCDVRQPLEAVLKGLTPSSSYIPFFMGNGDFMQPGHGDGRNAGFLREGSLLVIVAATNEDDCSTANLNLFRSDASAEFRGPVNLRCSKYTEALHPISRYVDGLLALRPGAPERLIYAPIVGVPTDLVRDEEVANWEAILADPRMIQMVDPADSTQLTPSCATARGNAFPPRRMIELAQQLEERGAGVALQSICGSNISPLLREIILRQSSL